MSFVTYRAGRAGDADIHLTHSEVSRRQIEITVTEGGRLYVVDCASSCGTFLWRNGTWEPFVQGYVEPNAEMAFGKQRFRLAELLKRMPDGHPRKQLAPVEPVSVRPRRKIETGEVELIPVKDHHEHEDQG